MKILISIEFKKKLLRKLSRTCSNRRNSFTSQRTRCKWICTSIRFKCSKTRCTQTRFQIMIWKWTFLICRPQTTTTLMEASVPSHPSPTSRTWATTTHHPIMCAIQSICSTLTTLTTQAQTTRTTPTALMTIRTKTHPHQTHLNPTKTPLFRVRIQTRIELTCSSIGK